MVSSHIQNTKTEMGKGYYECLLRKAERFSEKNTDSALKQVYKFVIFS